MGASWFVRPDTTILHLTGGKTLTVRRRLTMGEQRRAFARMTTTSEAGELKINRLEVSIAQAAAYLVDWNATDAGGDKVPIRGLSPDELITVLDNLRPEVFEEIKTAIEAHEAAMVREREAEKNGQDGESKSPAISPSPSDAAGASSGSALSTLTSTPS